MLRSLADAPLAAIPPIFARKRLADYAPASDAQRKALAAARSFLAGTISNLVLIGPPGVGKSHLAAAVAIETGEALWAAYIPERDAAEADRSLTYPRLPDLPRWLNVADALVAMRLEFGQPADDRATTAEVMAARRYPGLLVLDDLGRENVSDWTGELVYALVNARYEAERPTIVTSNLDKAQLAAGPYWAAISRLAERGAIVLVEGPDRRLAR